MTPTASSSTMDTTYTTGHVQPTIEEEDEDYSDEEQEEEFVSRSVQPSPNYRPYQPGNHLEPIMTGETLQIDDDGNPFDPGYYLAGPSYLPPMPPATPAGYDHYSDQDYLPPSRPVSAFSMSQGPSYQSVHEDEAYPPGNYPHNSFRSRSPTPAVDDEDYHIVGNVVRFTGTPEKVKAYDPEKYADQLRYSQYSSAYAYKDNYGKPPVNEAPVETKHYGPAPAGRVLRRHKTKKRVQLTNGNLVVDVDVPPKLVLPRRGEPETLQTRYTAVTCDPDHFEKKGFFLRQNENGRRTELFIVITMYNEDEVLFCRTLYGVMQNIAHLCTRKNSRTWGPDAWQKVVVCIVADGRRHVHPRVLDVLTLLGVYQPGGHMKNFVNQQEVTAHLFEYTTSFGMDSDLKFKFPDKGVMPTQIIFCLKEKNQKKINSHRWFFNAFGQMLQPNVCILLDVGTRPGKTSLYRLWKAFDVNSSVGGACGEISAYKGKHWLGLLNPLVAAQNFEYKMSSILDKPTESMFGYISVLPGAFSAYRYIALQNDKCGIGPLASYFKGEVLHGRDTDIFTSNMYLAEDRILCFELIAKAKSAWLLKYVKSAVGETDVPESLPEFISQRRRWLNGSFFAATYAIAHLGQVMNSGHSFTRKVLLFFETGYNIVNLVFAWFSLGNFYLFFVVLTSSLTDPIFHLQGIYYFNTVIQYIFTSLVVVCFLLSMGLKPQAAPFKYKITSIALGVCMLYMFFCSIMCSLQAVRLGGVSDHVMMFSVVITYGLYLFSSILAFDPWHMLTSFIPYLLLSPTYVNILNIYAFANLDDISWGTKEDTTAEPDLGAVVQDSRAQVAVEVFTEPADINVIYEDALFHLKNRTPNKSRESPLTETERELVAKHYYASVRTNLLLAWVLSNGVLIIAILAGSDPSATFSPSSSEFNRTKAYLIFILVFTTMTNLTRFGGSILYLLHRFVFG